MAATNETITLEESHDTGAAASLPFVPHGCGGLGGGAPCVALEGPRGAPRVALDTVAWRHQGKLRLTVVLKVALSLEASPMRPVDEAPLLRVDDEHPRGRPLAHVITPSDRVPYKQLVDVTVTGQAYAPGGRPAPEVRVRLAVLQAGKEVVDKALRVVGDRGAPGAPPKPFQRMPVTYERAMGGPGSPENPIGCGADEDDDLPNVLDPKSPERPVGLGPIGAAWPSRARRLAPDARKRLGEPVMELPADVDWAYFQHAPDDQRIPAITPDTTLVLEGLSPARPRVEARLPELGVAGAIWGLDEARTDAPRPLRFYPDTLHVDADALRCTVTYRCQVELRDDLPRERLVVAATAALGAPPALPAARPAAARGAQPSVAPPRRPSEATGATLDLESASGGITLPFQGAAKLRPALDATSILPSGAEPPRLAPSLPFGAPRPAAPAAAPFAPARMPLSGQLESPGAPAAPPRPSAPADAGPPIPLAGPARLGGPPEAAPPVASFVAAPSVPPIDPLRPSPEALASARGEPVPVASELFHDLTKLRGGVGVVPRARDAAALPLDAPGGATPAGAPAPAPGSIEEQMPLERYAEIASELDERDARRARVLDERGVEEALWKKAERHWRKVLDLELRRGERGQRDRYDEAYVAAWEARHPGVFGVEQYERLARAEARGLLAIELEGLGLGTPLGMRLKRVFRRRAAQSG
jgi:hypothetical protein